MKWTVGPGVVIFGLATAVAGVGLLLQEKHRAQRLVCFRVVAEHLWRIITCLAGYRSFRTQMRDTRRSALKPRQLQFARVGCGNVALAPS